jgi:hypothetical protein
MIISASALLLTATACPLANDIAPFTLATRPHVVDLMGAPYDWNLQQRGRADGQTLAANTANCNTCCIETQRGGKADQVHDCGFD